MTNDKIHEVIRLLRREVPRYREPIVGRQARKRRDPFRILIATLLSLRTKDEMTEVASERLFRVADTPESILKLKTEELERLIKPAGFYRNKAKTLKHVSGELLEKYEGKVPDDLDRLLAIKGVGRKTANLVITVGFGKPGICVDTHVHRITNRWGYVKTRKAHETETALRKKLPKEYWIEINDLLVVWGQQICRPISPFCSRCVLFDHCDRTAVKKSR